jgi:drug/metabolite transporter (DMT)-like permease
MPVPLTLSTQWTILTGSELWLYVILLVGVSTMIAFGLMFYFQPRLDPTRAALIYLAEPIFAALYAYLAVGRTLSVTALLGAGLILAANVLVEFLERRGKRPTVVVASVTP